ncbi:MAG TPA: Mur ligase domain-containing protein, partial [Chitinophagaceae bacterium]|nr:Mur ligase domain-containing protein [Chitinophagaceae bacterium]
MNNLQDILYKVHIKQVIGTTQLNVKNVQIDSRCVSNGSVFIAIKGDKTDGHHFIEQVIQNGAIAVICQTIPERIDPNITYVLVENTHEALAV